MHASLMTLHSTLMLRSIAICPRPRSPLPKGALIKRHALRDKSSIDFVTRAGHLHFTPRICLLIHQRRGVTRRYLILHLLRLTGDLRIVFGPFIAHGSRWTYTFIHLTFPIPRSYSVFLFHEEINRSLIIATRRNVLSIMSSSPYCSTLGIYKAVDIKVVNKTSM